MRHFETIEELYAALAAFAKEYNASWLRQRHGHKTPNQIRAEQKALDAEAATMVEKCCIISAKSCLIPVPQYTPWGLQT